LIPDKIVISIKGVVQGPRDRRIVIKKRMRIPRQRKGRQRAKNKQEGVGNDISL